MPTNSKPHVVVLLADQLRRDVLGCYGGQHLRGQSPSPHIDALAAESVLQRSHTINCPLCVPSRISMVTGLHPHVHGAIVNAWDKEEEPFGTCRGKPSLYETLAEAGYRVEHVGTNHLRMDPPLAGRHVGIHFSGSNVEHAEHLKRRGIKVDYSPTRSPCLEFAGGQPVTRMYTNPNTVRWPGAKEDFLDCWIADHIVATVEEHATTEQPLALMGNFWLPHPPLSCPEPYYSMCDGESLALPEIVGRWCDGHSPMHLVNLPGHVAASITSDGWRKAWAVYLGMVRILDECIGRIVAALKRRGIWDEALVIFSSDHGEMLGSHRMFQKMCMYEDSIRVPMLIKPPGFEAQGEIHERMQLTQHLDLAATICDYAGLPPQFGSGRSFREIVSDRAAPGRAEVFAEFNGNSGRSFQQRAIITPTHKYIYNHGYAPELYDLVADPDELNNLCQLPSPPPQAAQLRNRLREWMAQTNDCIAME